MSLLSVSIGERLAPLVHLLAADFSAEECDAMADAALEYQDLGSLARARAWRTQAARKRAARQAAAEAKARAEAERHAIPTKDVIRNAVRKGA